VQVTPEKRAQAKQMAYGLLYGMGKHALAKNMGVSPDTAQQLSDSFRASIPTLVRPGVILRITLPRTHGLGAQGLHR